MPYLRKWILSGNVIEAAEYYSWRTPKTLAGSFTWNLGKKSLRGKNRRITAEQQRKLNNRNSVMHACRVMNNNFGPDDTFATLDLRVIPLLRDGALDEEYIKKEYIAKFNRWLRKEYRDAGVEYKYFWVIEKETPEGPVRPHVHVLLPKFSFDAIVKCWPFGGVTIRRLDTNRDYKGIADYLSKDPTLGTNHKKRWGASKNLRQPEIPPAKRIVYPGGYIKPPKGYKEIIDRSYWSDITGMSRYVRFVKMDGMDISGVEVNRGRAGPDPIPWLPDQFSTDGGKKIESG